MRVSLKSTHLGQPGCLAGTRRCRAPKKLAPALPKLRETHYLMEASACERWSA